MLSFKRSVTIALALAIALTGVITASANTATQDQTTPDQQVDGTAAWLGVSIRDTDNGVMISDVMPASPADEAGLRHGDIITAAAETEIDSAATLVETIQALAPGDVIAVTFKRGGEPDTVMVTLGERPTAITGEMPFGPGPAGQATVQIMNMLGMNLEVTDEGMVIQTITPNSPFAGSGLQEGDLITAIDGDSVAGEFYPTAVLGHVRFNEPIVFSVVRGDEVMEVEVELDEGDLNMPMHPSDSDLQIQPVPLPRPTQLGVQFLTINAEVVEEHELAVDQGALLVEVFEDTPAAAAGLQAGDIILAVDGDVVDDERTLPDRLYAYEEGDVVTLLVLRDGEEIEVEVELGPHSRGMAGITIQGVPLQPNPELQRPGFFGFGGRMGRGPRGFFGMMPHHGGMMHPFGDGGFFEFDFGDHHFGDHHPFWGQDDDPDSGKGDDSMDEAPDTDSGTSM